ncbi:DNA polymerase phi subunit [Pseudohyphozyma bogoriensis]|nr:DNA polymerase phi subunit [Pseudohyphozyma bogoriensis]
MSFLPLFPLLSSHDLPTRLDSSVTLITSLPLDNSSSDDADTPYAVKRLVNGLGSSNEASRQGFAVALAELLARLPPKKADEVLPLILSTSTPTAGSDSREERDLLFARLFGLHAVLRSGVVTRPSTTNGETFKEVVLALLALAGKKSWMRESAYWVMIEGVRSLLELDGAAAPAWRDDITAWIIQRLLNDSREKARGWGPEKVALILTLQSNGVEADYTSVLAPEFPSGNILSRSSLVTLAKALKGTSVDENAAAGPSKAPKMGSNAVKTSKGGAPTPGAAPHFVWTEIFDLYFPNSSRNAPKDDLSQGRAKWSEVWRILVDQSLFAPPSLPLKATGFALLTLAIQRLPPTEIPALFGEGVMRTFNNHLRKSADGEKTLNRVAEKLAASLPPFLTANPSISFPLLEALVAPPHGSHQFDHRTVEKVVAKLDLKGVRSWVKYLKDFIIGEEQTVDEGEAIPDLAADEKIVTAQRLWAFDQLLHVAKVGGLEKDDEILAGLLEFFAVLGWFEVRKSGKGARSYVPTPAFTETLQIASRSRFFSILTALPLDTWLPRALGLLDNLAADSKNFTPIEDTEDDIITARKEVKTMYKKLAGDDDRKKTARSLVEGVLLLSYDEGEDSSEALEAIKDCVTVLFPDIFPKPEDEDEEMDDEEGDEPEPATVLIDLVLELLHRPSAFVKGVAQTVFTGFAGELGEQGLELILEQIRPEEVDVAEEEGEGAPVVNGGHDHAHDHEEPEASTSNGKASKKRKAPAPESEDSEEDSDGDDDDSEESDAEVDEAFRNELLAALQANGVANEFDAAESESEDGSEEELLDDDQMMALDDKLADIFRLQGGGNKGKKAERMDDLHYRLRVVDLLELLGKQRTANPLLTLIVLPLFSIVRRSTPLEKELTQKSLKLLRQIVSRKDVPAPASPDSTLEALAELHAVSQIVDSADFATLCSQTSVFLVKSALASPAADKSTSAAISKLFGDSFDAYLSKKNAKTRVQPALTIEFAKRSPACAWGMLEQVVSLANGDGAANAFRRMQAFDVAQALFTSQASLKTPESKAKILSAVPSYRDAILKVLSTSVSDPSTTFDAARLKELVKLALAAVRITIGASSSAEAQKLWKGKEFAPVLDGLKSSERFKGAVGVQNLLKQLLVVLGGEKEKKAEAGEKKKKRKVEEPEVEVEVEEEEMAVDESPKKKKKKDKKKDKKA